MTKEEILHKNKCEFHQKQFLGKNGVEPLGPEEITGTVDALFKAMDEYAKECVKSAEMQLPYAIGRLCEELEKDKSEGSYYYSWQANIAMAFQDEYRKEFGDSPKMRVFMHEVSNNAAKNFLNMLCHRPTPEPKPSK